MPLPSIKPCGRCWFEGEGFAAALFFAGMVTLEKRHIFLDEGRRRASRLRFLDVHTTTTMSHSQFAYAQDLCERLDMPSIYFVASPPTDDTITVVRVSHTSECAMVFCVSSDGFTYDLASLFQLSCSLDGDKATFLSLLTREPLERTVFFNCVVDNAQRQVFWHVHLEDKKEANEVCDPPEEMMSARVLERACAHARVRASSSATVPTSTLPYLAMSSAESDARTMPTEGCSPNARSASDTKEGLDAKVLEARDKF